MEELKIPTSTGIVLDGARFSNTRIPKAQKTVVIAITGVHGNFYSNPFYVNIGETLSKAGIDFIYAQTRDAFSQIEIENSISRQQQIIGSWNEDFAASHEDIAAYLVFAEAQGYKNIVLAGHSLGANKVIRYLSESHDSRVSKFILLSPANLRHMTSLVDEAQKAMILNYMASGREEELLPFPLLGWLPSVARTAHDWVFSDLLNNVHVEEDADFSQMERIQHSGALLIGTYDRFTYGNPAHFLSNINDHMPTRDNNQLIFIERTGHTYQQKEQELAEALLELVSGWEKELNLRKEA